MNTFTTVITATVLTLTTATVSAKTSHLIPTDDSVTTKLCMTAARGNSHALRKEIKQSRLTTKFVLENVKCNEQSFLSFIDQHGKNSEKINYLLTRGRQVTTATDTEIAAR
ncbi:DUF3718 domain-containing protein [Thalassotalea sp. PLHSN55]|uniref:DUF3718 domain-containing protein n=1 Tax=Thalassotalea sp. PLHSN55 TaxID=3435888 RepID=UPI003F86AF07